MNGTRASIHVIKSGDLPTARAASIFRRKPKKSACMKSASTINRN